MAIGFQQQNRVKDKKINQRKYITERNKDSNEIKCADHIYVYFKQRQQVLKRKENVNQKIKVLF